MRNISKISYEARCCGITWKDTLNFILNFIYIIMRNKLKI